MSVDHTLAPVQVCGGNLSRIKFLLNDCATRVRGHHAFCVIMKRALPDGPDSLCFNVLDVVGSSRTMCSYVRVTIRRCKPMRLSLTSRSIRFWAGSLTENTGSMNGSAVAGWARFIGRRTCLLIGP